MIAIFLVLACLSCAGKASTVRPALQQFHAYADDLHQGWQTPTCKYPATRPDEDERDQESIHIAVHQRPLMPHSSLSLVQGSQPFKSLVMLFLAFNRAMGLVPSTPACSVAGARRAATAVSMGPRRPKNNGRGKGRNGGGRGSGQGGEHDNVASKELQKLSVATTGWEELQKTSGYPAERVFEARQRLFGAEAPVLKFWHDVAGWCPHCMTAWTVLDEMKIPYVMETSPLRAYLKPGEKKPAALRAVSPKGVVPIVQFLDNSRSTDDSWVFKEPVPNVGRGEQVCQMLAERFPLQALWPNDPALRAHAEKHLSLFERLQKAYRPYKYLPNGKPTWGVTPKHTQKDKDILVASLDDLEAALGSHSDSKRGKKKSSKKSMGPFLLGNQPYMVDMMLMPYLERVEALLLHPFLGGTSGLLLERWPRVSKMLAASRKPGVCSFGELSSDAETLLAISLRDDGWRLSENAAQNLLTTSLRDAPKLPVADAAHLASEHTAAVCKDTAARICANHAAIVAFACCGRGCGRGQEAAEIAKGSYHPSASVAVAVDIAMRSIVVSLLRQGSDQEELATWLGAGAKLCARALGSDGALVAPALHFLSLNIGVPKDMSVVSAAALRAHLKLFVTALEDEGHDGSLHVPKAKPQEEKRTKFRKEIEAGKGKEEVFVIEL